MPERSVVVRWATWLGVLALVTLVLAPVRSEIEQSHIVLTLMLVVLGGSSGGGRPLGIALALASFVIIDYAFQPPYDFLSVDKALDWVVLLAFLAVAFVATELLSRLTQQAEAARQHANEVTALATERERLAAQVQEARTVAAAALAKDQVLAAVSHDLRTPLATIKVLAQGATPGDAKAQGLIVEEVDRLTRMVSDVLDLSRLRSGRVTLEIELNTAEDLVGTAVQRVQAILDGKQVVTDLDMSQPVLAGRFDLVHSLRIVGNLLDNALRYTPPGGTVRVSTLRDGAWMVVRVSDDGPGVSAAEAARIFEPFYRPQTEVADAGHAGLGLSIAKQLAEMQGGSVAYEPRPEGGSDFTLRLPGADWAADAMPES